jgi:putative ABC transport system permease protein
LLLSISKIFTFPFVKGNPETALNHPDSIVLTEGTAYKYFGSENPLGKRILLENRWEFTVTGIIKDVPGNSHLKFDLLAPFSFNEKEEMYGKDLYHKNWGQANFITYLLLAEGVAPEGLEEKIKQLTKDVGAYPRYNWTYYLQSLNDIHLKSNLRAEVETNSNLATLWFYSLIGLIVLIIACINYMNLALARAPVSHFVLLAGKVIVTGIGAGIYPALFLSAFKPVKVFRSTSSLVSRGAGLRKILVLVQFSLSILFIISTLVVWNQLKFIKNRKLGLNKEQVVNVPLFKEVRDKYEAIKDEIKKHSGVVNAAASNFSPSQDPYNHGLWWEGMTKDDNKMMHWLAVDHDFRKRRGDRLIKHHCPCICI